MRTSKIFVGFREIKWISLDQLKHLKTQTAGIFGVFLHFQYTDAQIGVKQYPQRNGTL